jgi:hypothetical protein
MKKHKKSRPELIREICAMIGIQYRKSQYLTRAQLVEIAHALSMYIIEKGRKTNDEKESSKNIRTTRVC